MDLEQTLRAAFVLRAPAPDFEDVVMARLSGAARRASPASPRRWLHMLLIGAVLAGAAAAAMIAARYSGASPMPATLSAGEVGAVNPLAAQHAVPASVPVTPVAVSAPAAVPPATPSAIDTSQLCMAEAAAPSAAPVYTVLVEPLQFETDNAAIQSWGQQYYDTILKQLRMVPGLALVGKEVQTTAAKPADYRVQVVMNNKPDGRVNADRAAWRMELTLETWTGAAFSRGVSTSTRDVHTLDGSSCMSGTRLAVSCSPQNAALGEVVGLKAQLPRFPTPVQAACDRAFQESIAEQRRSDPTTDIEILLRKLERLAATRKPTERANTWRTLANSTRPELVQPLVAALRDSSSDAIRHEAVTMLAVKFAGDPKAREALAAVAASGQGTLTRHVAERALSGDEPWREYAFARLRDTSLSTDQRLEAWYWMIDAMQLDKQRSSTTLAGMLTAIQQNEGIRVLADLLAGTQKEPGEENGLAAQQGRWTMSQIGSLNHPVAPDLLIACFDAVPNTATLGSLATRRDDPRVSARLESIAAEHEDPELRRWAANYLRRPLDPQQINPTGN